MPSHGSAKAVLPSLALAAFGAAALIGAQKAFLAPAPPASGRGQHFLGLAEAPAASSAQARVPQSFAPTVAAAAAVALAGLLGLGSRSSFAGGAPSASFRLVSVRAAVAEASATPEDEENDVEASTKVSEEEEEDEEDDVASEAADESFEALSMDRFKETDEDSYVDETEDGAPSLRAVCRARFLKGGPKKFERVLWQIRGRSYRDALIMLEFLPWRACKPVLKALQSAAANAQNHLNMDKTRLYITKAIAKQGPKMKRMRAVSKGQAHAYLRRQTHLTIYVAEMSDQMLEKQVA